MRKTIISFMVVAMLAMSSLAALAISEGDFIGKGEVQGFFDWNNKELQDNADNVLVTATTTSEWTCSGVNPSGREVIQERETSVVTSATTAGRLRNQITGFHVGEIIGNPVVVGPAVGTCSAAGFEVTFDEGSIVYGDTVYSFDLAE
jgi:hypothetical protein